ncbi:hypothetical protein D1007_15827 [Hordeum vulgare]|nr:hypothetical protein D1007_15827 [Hordeum vulgare]
MTKFPVSSSIAAVPPASMVVILFVVVQRVLPLESNKARSELLVTRNLPDELPVIGLSRFATHTYVRCGMLLYHMPMYEFVAEFVGEKKPRVKMPPLEMSLSPGESGFVGVMRSSDLQKQIKNRRMKTGM